MPQTSGPFADEPFTDEQWRFLVGDEAGIVGDVDGTGFRLTLSSSSNEFLLGSDTAPSLANVAGRLHKIGQGNTERYVGIIPDAVGGPQVHIIASRHDPAWSLRSAGADGPVRTVVISGTAGGGSPSFDGGYPGVEDLPHWKITRQPGKALTDPTTVVEDLRTWRSHTIHVRTRDQLPLDVPIGTVAFTRAGETFIRQRTAQGSVRWLGQVADVFDGTEGYMIGSAPPAGTPKYRREISRVVTTTALGGWNIPLGITAPNGIVHMTASPGDTAGDHDTSVLILPNCTLSAANGVARTTSGGPVASRAIRVNLNVAYW